MVDRRSFLLASSQLAAAMLAGKAFGRDATDDPAYLPASKLLTRFRERKLAPVDVLEAQIARIETLNDKVNCITFKHFDEAREAARESEKRHADGNPRALEGIKVAVKDEYETKGWVTTMGSPLPARA
jgi:amidase